MSRKADRVIRKVLADGTVKEYRYGARPKAAPYEGGTLGELLLADTNSNSSGPALEPRVAVLPA